MWNQIWHLLCLEDCGGGNSHLPVIIGNWAPNQSDHWGWPSCNAKSVCLQSLYWVLNAPLLLGPEKLNQWLFVKSTREALQEMPCQQVLFLVPCSFTFLPVIWMKTESHTYQICRWQILEFMKVKWEKSCGITVRLFLLMIMTHSSKLSEQAGTGSKLDPKMNLMWKT